MTRFARAKGSKSSNEKAPEDSTPWEVMKEQLMQAKKEGEDSKKRQEAEKQRIENYENFLKEHKKQKRKAEWCDFPEVEEKLTARPEQNNKTKKNKSKHSQSESNLLQQNVEDLQEVSPKPKKHKKNKQIAVDSNPFQEQSLTAEDNSNKKHKKEKKNNKGESQHENKTQEDGSVPNGELITSKKKKKKNKKQPNLNEGESFETENELIDGSTHKSKKQKKNKKKHENSLDTETVNENNSNMGTKHLDVDKSTINKQNKIKALKKKKDKKLLDGAPIRRKEIDHSFQLIINGKEVELVRYDGFPIMKKDAIRLEELKNSMIKKGIPKSEVQRNMKLERRRAEKALARLKRDVCYNCRKGGHNLSDCPDLKSKIPGADGADGVCFKCGSTEHRQIDCKVQRDKEFRFATCFICKEPGHIARQCPDNPKGLYPNGGACKLCGDVTHLRKDCPTVNEKKETSTVKLQTLATSDNIEDVGAPINTVSAPEPSKKPKKITF